MGSPIQFRRRLGRLEAVRGDDFSRLSDAELEAHEVAVLHEILQDHPQREAIVALPAARRIIATLPIVAAYLAGQEWDGVIVLPAADPSPIELATAMGNTLSCRA